MRNILNTKRKMIYTVSPGEGSPQRGGSAMPGNAIQARRREEDGALFECLRYLIKTTEAWHGVFDDRQGMNLDLG